MGRGLYTEGKRRQRPNGYRAMIMIIITGKTAVNLKTDIDIQGTNPANNIIKNMFSSKINIAIYIYS